MKNFKRVLTTVLVLLVLFFSIKSAQKYLDKVYQETARIEKGFQLAAKNLVLDIDNDQLQLVGPKKIERINGVIQTEWILVSSVQYNKSLFYAFKVYNLPTPNGLKKWVMLPCFYSPKGVVEDWVGYHIDVFDDQLFDPELLNAGYYQGYKYEPFYSTFQLLKKFVEWQKNQAKH